MVEVLNTYNIVNSSIETDRIWKNNKAVTTIVQKPRCVNCLHLPAEKRASAAMAKYAEAVEMYATTNLSVREIADRCSVTSSTGLSGHIYVL